MLKIVLPFFILICFLQTAHAVIPGGGGGGMSDCADGTKAQGTFNFDGFGALQYCDSANWQSLDGGLNLSLPCTGQGRVRYYSGSMQYCDGSYWHPMDGNTTTTACGYAGTMISARSGYPAYCDGSNWHIMLPGGAGPSNLVCNDFTMQKHCLKVPGCFWNAGYCYEPSDCASRYTSYSCLANPSCSWGAGVCGSAI